VLDKPINDRVNIGGVFAWYHIAAHLSVCYRFQVPAKSFENESKHVMQLGIMKEGNGRECFLSLKFSTNLVKMKEVNNHPLPLINHSVNYEEERQQWESNFICLHLISQCLLGKGSRLVNLVTQYQQWNTTQRWLTQQVMDFTSWNANIVMISSINNITARKENSKTRYYYGYQDH